MQEAGGLVAAPGAYVPQCDEHGEYKPLQTHAGTGQSWCVDRHGTEIPGSRTPADKPAPSCLPFTPGTHHSLLITVRGSVDSIVFSIVAKFV